MARLLVAAGLIFALSGCALLGPQKNSYGPYAQQLQHLEKVRGVGRRAETLQYLLAMDPERAKTQEIEFYEALVELSETEKEKQSLQGELAKLRDMSPAEYQEALALRLKAAEDKGITEAQYENMRQQLLIADHQRRMELIQTWATLRSTQ